MTPQRALILDWLNWFLNAHLSITMNRRRSTRAETLGVVADLVMVVLVAYGIRPSSPELLPSPPGQMSVAERMSNQVELSVDAQTKTTFAV